MFRPRLQCVVLIALLELPFRVSSDREPNLVVRDPRSAAKALQRSCWKPFRLANIQKSDRTAKRCHPYMFRDAFAVKLLLVGVPLDQVSLLLGHSSVKITERHCASFCKARQEQLAAAVKLACKKSGPRESAGGWFRMEITASSNRQYRSLSNSRLVSRSEVLLNLVAHRRVDRRLPAHCFPAVEAVPSSCGSRYSFVL